ncbi:hypothetical protein OsccyDRAFT_3186 [Leptolyngbyaceae cyanobacterium JSC-12]|nr:hypothetical protein OsccyDRAFT_3186 [Leptolyngbyaceae cyanobacterium JSC-12]
MITLRKYIQQYRIDIFIVLSLAVAIAGMSFLASQQVPDPIIQDFYAQDAWFGSDIPTVFGNITSVQSDFGRNNKHPLFPLFIFPPIFLVGKIFRLEPILAARVVLALVVAIWTGLLFVLFRLVSGRRLDATLFSLVGGVSAAAIFWFVVPESFPFGSLTILIALVFVVLTQYQKLSPAWFVALNVVTLSVTITNWMVGILTTLVNQRWKKFLQIMLVSFGVANVLWIVQRVIFRNSGYSFSLRTFIGEKKFMAEPEHGSVLSAISSFFYQTIVMPASQFSDSLDRPGWAEIQVDTLAPGSGGFWGTIAVIAWTGLLGLGIWGFFSTNQYPKLRIVLGLTILGQLFMHSIYGSEETFIYSLHFAPLLITLAAFSSLTRLRLVGLVFAAVLVVSAGINNRSQFNQVTTALLDYGTQQQRLEAQMQVRPSDPWGRNVGHVVVAIPGTDQSHKAYYEPGGSFSPVAGSFGVTIWLLDKDGNLQTTSDAIPLDKIQQQFVDIPGSKTPGIRANTEFYEAIWSPLSVGTWQLNLKVPAQPSHRTAIVFRSVGPAGGAISSLNWDEQRLLINDRWSIKNIPSQARVYLGSERSPGWMQQKSDATQWSDEKGWGFARVELGEGTTWNLVIEDSATLPKPVLQVSETPETFALNLPDQQFVDSLKAQVNHLLMGLVGDRTRPSDPLSYTLPRFRDGAYQLVALARSGQLEVARQLSTYFAETDFLNGTHSEADIPALGIWALETVAKQLQQPDYDQWLWSHVRRKAELIMDMATTNRPGYPVVEQSKIPFSEHPDFLTTDTVSGKMDGAQGLISLDTTASIMSYRALQDAAALADRMNQPADAKRWREQANQMQTVWQKRFQAKFSRLDASYTNGLWPSWIAAINQNEFDQSLQTHWAAQHDKTGRLRQPPANPFFNLAETHQWLLLGDRDRVWSTLKWFWEHQASPGLYTWWGNNDGPEASASPQSLSHWHRFRGWVNPPNITPHYRTAAEMALLQLDMLAYVDQAKSIPTLVIGAGVQPQWLSQPLNVKGLAVGGNLVNWNWDGKQLTVQIQGEKIPVQLGSAFPPNVPVNVVVMQKAS